MDVSQAIKTKRATRIFQETPVPEELIERILDAGRRAQSSKNGQAWRYIAITNRKKLIELSECGSFAGHIAGAAFAVALLSPDPAEKFQTMFDLGQAAAYMQLAAWEQGIGSCPASIYEFENARQVLGFDPEWHLRIALSFGYPKPPDQQPVAVANKGRKRLAEIVEYIR